MNPKALMTVAALICCLFDGASKRKRKKEKEYRRNYENAYTDYRKQAEAYDKEYEGYKDKL